MKKSIGNIDVRILSNARLSRNAEYQEGMPIYLAGEDLLKYRK